MSDLPKEQENHESAPKKTASEAVSVTGDVFISKVRGLLGGEDTNMEALRLSLPPAVVEIARQEELAMQKLQLSSPSLLQVAQSIKMKNAKHENGTFEGSKYRPNYAGMAEGYWLLDHYSDEQSSVSDEQRQELRECARSIESPQNRLSETLHSPEEPTVCLEYFFYLLVRLLAMKQRLEKKQQTPVLQEHKDMLEEQCFLVLEQMNRIHESGLSIQDPKRFIEDKLLSIGILHPALKTQISRLSQVWDLWRDESKRIHRERYEFMLAKRNVRQQMAFMTPAQRLKQTEKDTAVTSLVDAMGEAMTPDSVDDLAWDEPLEYIENLTDGSPAVFMNAYKPRGVEDGSSKGQQFQLDLYKGLADKGFKKWLLLESDSALRPIQQWLKEKDDSRSLQELTDILGEYMRQRLGNSLHSFMTLPTGDIPENVMSVIRYFEDFWEAKEEACATLHIPAFRTFKERDHAALGLMISGSEKLLCSGFLKDEQLFRILEHSSHSKAPVFLHHASTQSKPDRIIPGGWVNVDNAMGYAAHIKKRSRGVYQTSAVPGHGKEEHLALFGRHKTFNGIQIFTQGASRFVDACVFTKERGDDDRKNESRGPSRVDTGSPVMSGA